MQNIKILKVRIDTITLKEAGDTAIKWALENKQRYITTPNPEIILEAQNNGKFLRTLNQSDLNIADGAGLIWAAKYLDITRNKDNFTKIVKWFTTLLKFPFNKKFFYTVLPQRVTGVDLMNEICKKIAKTDRKIFLLGARKGVAEKVKIILEKKHPGLNISGTFAGTPSIKEENDIIKRIIKSQANILFVAYGAPKQESWIKRNQKKIPNIKLAVGIGGSFNFIAKIKKRAPKWMQNLGIEWLFRLIQEPGRANRIYNATIKFPIKILKKNLK